MMFLQTFVRVPGVKAAASRRITGSIVVAVRVDEADVLDDLGADVFTHTTANRKNKMNRRDVSRTFVLYTSGLQSRVCILKLLKHLVTMAKSK